jgi:hypothetical protein
MKSFIINIIEYTLIILFILFEEIIYETIAKPIIKYYKSLKILKKLKSFINGKPPFILLTIFIISFLIAEILGLLSLPLILLGPPIMFIGFLLYSIKIPIAAFAFWLFKEYKKEILKYKILNKIYLWIVSKIDILKETDMYKRVKEKLSFIKESLKNRKGLFKEILTELKIKYKFIRKKMKEKK